MVRRDLSASRRCECSRNSGGAGGDSNSNPTYNLKIFVDVVNERGYIDKSPILVYNDFVELIRQRYYIRYAEGDVHMRAGDETSDMPVFYIGSCMAGKCINESDGTNTSYYDLEFSTNDFTISVSAGDDQKTGLVGIRLHAWTDEDYVTQYNNEELGNAYIIFNLTFVWKQLD